MAREQREITVTAFVSRHNSPQDNADDRVFNDLCARIRGLVTELGATEAGERISLAVSGDDQHWTYPDWKEE